MKLMSFNLNKIDVEKFSENFKDLKINTNLSFSEIKSLDQDLFKTDNKFIKSDFKFVIDYSPNTAKLVFNGSVIVSLDSKKAKKILQDWEKKETDEDFQIFVFNIILRKVSIKALQLEDEMNLPPHIAFPLIQKKEELKKKE